MKNRGGRFLLILGAGLAVMAFVVVYIVMSKGMVSSGDSASVPTAVPMVSVAVMNQDVPAYTVLDASNVATRQVEASTVPSNTTTDPATLYNKMTLLNLKKNQTVQTNELTEAGFSSVLKKGEHAFTLAVPERSTFGGTVTENDRIDVLWTTGIQFYQKKPLADNKFDYSEKVFTSTKALLQNVRVLRVITLTTPAPASGANSAPVTPADQTTGASANSAMNAATNAALYSANAPYQEALVLGVTDQQAEVLKYARENGSLDLTLRSSATVKDKDGNVVKDPATGEDQRLDADAEQTTGISINLLIEKYGLPVPQIAP